MENSMINDDSRKRLIIFIGIVLLGAIGVLVYAGMTGNLNQKFTDFVVEFTAIDGSNKDAERTMFYLFSLFGIILYTLIFTIGKFGEHEDVRRIYSSENLSITLLAVSFLTNLIVYKTINTIALAGIIVIALAIVRNKNLVIPVLVFMCMVIYGICGAYRLLVYAGAGFDISINKTTLVALLVSIVFMLISKNEKLLIRGILLAQLLIPFTLLIYLASNYICNGEQYIIHISKRVQIVIFALIILFIIESVLRIKNNWNEEGNMDAVISYGACVCIMAFNRFSGTGSIMDSDLHHPFENVIGYSQVFELGQKLFSEYIPVSGMYSILQGWVLAVFGRGYGSFYHLTQNLFYLGIIIVIVFLLRRQLNGIWTLLVSVMLMITDYNRISLIIPIILLLSWPQLISKKNLWLKAWFLTSFIHGLYYPVFGAAVCFGFLPLGIWQIYTYAKSGELLRDVRTVKFWIWWIICFIPVGLGFRWLIGTVKHMLAMGSQTIYADGVARFGQIVSGDFFPYISNMSIRVTIFYLFTCMILISLIWLSFALFLKSGNVTLDNRHIKIVNPENAFLSLSIGIMLLVSFSYTVVRFDYYDIYSRSYGVVSASFVILIILVSRFTKEQYKNILWILGFSVFIISAVSAEGFLHISEDSKLEANYDVPEGYVYVNYDKPRLGEAFLKEEDFEYIYRTYSYMNTLDRDKSYLGIVDSFGLFYLCDMKGDSVMEVLNTIKGYTAVEETVDIIRENNSIVGLNVNPLKNYYLYHWLLTSGDYVFDNDARLFFPNDTNVSREDILVQNKNISLPLDYMAEDIGKVAGSFGSSMDTLMPIFSEPELNYSMEKVDSSLEVSFEEPFDGNDADFLYIEFANMVDDSRYVLYDYHTPVEQNTKGILNSLMRKEYNPYTKVTISWTNDAGEERSQTCDMDEGKLLFPLGSVRGWLMNSHSKVTITVCENDNEIVVPEIKDIKILKLREVE